ncbi:fimbrial protein [Achromobacter aegrifaciens]|uniref:fimbrial protein n=2 Tax=Bacteria TaxID=2 RepID=UPI00141A3532|nr:fimbrial protein [Achromobacter aegrifaciens]
MKMLRNLYSFGALLLLLALSPNAYAALCSNGQIPAPFSGNQEITVDPDAPVGQVLKTVAFWANGYHSGAGTCLTATVRMSFNGSGTQVAPNVFATGIPGVGIRTKVTGGTCGTGYVPFSCTGRFSGAELPRVDFIYELIKTGPITSKTISSPTLFTMTDDYQHPATGSNRYAYVFIWGDLTVKVKQPPTCSVSSAGPIKRSLGSVPATSFKGVGSTSPERPFSIDLKCSGGDPGMSAEAYVTLTDATNTDNRSNVLALSPDSQARGIGIEILKGTTVLGYGPDSKVAGNVNQWHAGSVSTGTGTFLIPLSARYVQTDPVVTAGSANGRATFTMSYQ